MRKKMLIVDDNENLREALQLMFEDHYDLKFAASGEEAIQSFDQFNPEVVLMDFQMPGLDGVQTMQVLREQSAQSQMIIMSAYNEKERVRSAFRNGAFDFVTKPFDVKDLKTMVENAAANADKIINFQPSAYLVQAKEAAFNQREVDQMVERTLQAACC